MASTSQARLSLDNLPPEILLQIHFLSKNPSLSFVSTACHTCLTPPYVTTTYVAEYLLNLYSSSPANGVLVRALRHPVCTEDVASSIQRIWDRRRGYVPQSIIEGEDKEDKGKRKDDGDSSASRRSPSPRPSPPAPPTRPALSVPELPRRLFRGLTSHSGIPPLLRYIFNTYSPSANSHNGYPLARAVLAKNKDITSYLLSRGAEPGLRDGLAIEIAVKLGDIELVRLLVDNAYGREVEITPKFVELAVRSGSDQIVQYFVHDKGVMPPLHSIMRLSSKPKKAGATQIDVAADKRIKRKRSSLVKSRTDEPSRKKQSKRPTHVT